MTFRALGGLAEKMLMQSPVIIGIHGTFVKTASWLGPGQPLVKHIKRQFPTAKLIDDFTWSGRNSQVDREKAAVKIASIIKNLPKSTETIFLIGHSHGGNIAVQSASKAKTSSKIRIISISTPFIHYKERDPQLSVLLSIYFAYLAVFVSLAFLSYDPIAEAARNYVNLGWPLEVLVYTALNVIVFFSGLVFAKKFGMDQVASFFARPLKTIQSAYLGLELTENIKILVVGDTRKDFVRTALRELGNISERANRYLSNTNTIIDGKTNDYLRRSKTIYTVAAGLLILSSILGGYVYLYDRGATILAVAALILAFTVLIALVLWMGFHALRIAEAAKALIEVVGSGAAGSLLYSSNITGFLAVRAHVGLVPMLAGSGSDQVEVVELGSTGLPGIRQHGVGAAQAAFPEMVAWMARQN